MNKLLITLFFLVGCSAIVDEPEKENSDTEELTDTEQSTDPCDNLTCDLPPMDECTVNGLVFYSDTGVCVEGECHYPSETTVCSHNCQVEINADDYCKDLCEDLICDTPPQPECTEDGNLKIINSEGMCIEGECHYAFDINNCPFGCLKVNEQPDECAPAPCVHDEQRCTNEVIEQCNVGVWGFIVDCSESGLVCEKVGSFFDCV